MRPGKQNGGPTLSPPRTRSPEALTSRPPQRESRRAGAIPGSQFQKGEPETAKAAQQLRSQTPPNSRFAICDLKLVLAACPASAARKDRVQKKGRTIQNCIAR